MFKNGLSGRGSFLALSGARSSCNYLASMRQSRDPQRCPTRGPRSLSIRTDSNNLPPPGSRMVRQIHAYLVGWLLCQEPPSDARQTPKVLLSRYVRYTPPPQVDQTFLFGSHVGGFLPSSLPSLPRPPTQCDTSALHRDIDGAML